ncbi:Phosphoserine phosphatase [hydrothermal vent metagenome]|uniref:Phosphoserine phosphatase n=1 Tax=hydrothermal vent metagenome TaxID=652676 RepID=A0A3B1BKQ8_9ZZZZ
MTLAIFDLDNTLLDGDSDYLWGRFLSDEGLVDEESYEIENKRFYEEYKAGVLDIFEFLAFSLQPLSEHSMEELAVLHEKFMNTIIRPRIPPAARQLLEKHRKNGDFLLIITATNLFITAPIARELGVDDIIATDAEIKNERYTGKVEGVPCFREGKVTRLEQWLKQQGQNLAESWFYSDSHNDLPLLERVSHPVAVDPDETLADHAKARGWPILSLKGREIIPLNP